MAVIESEPMSMSEAAEYLEDERDSDLKGFVKKFVTLSAEDAKKLRSEIDALELMKVKPEHVAKIIDILPESEEELNKIFVGISLDEDESKNILDKVKQYK